MISELFLYDQDAGLFKNILVNSTVMQGRFFVGDLAKVTADQVYPCVVCLPPKSLFTSADFLEETFTFQLFFLTKTGITGQNQIKSPNPDNLTSLHPVWYDWKDMKECANNFMRIVKQLIAQKLIDDVPMKSLIAIDTTRLIPQVLRISNAGTSNASGVSLTFNVILKNNCQTDDYPGLDIDTVTIPDTNLHPLHKH